MHLLAHQERGLFRSFSACSYASLRSANLRTSSAPLKSDPLRQLFGIEIVLIIIGLTWGLAIGFVMAGLSVFLGELFTY
jgi:hypothetical protein